SVEQISASHKKQVQTYLRLTGLKLGYLLSFGEAVLKSGITRCVNGLEEEDLPLRRGTRRNSEWKYKKTSAPQRLCGTTTH
ncbi:MAG: GxxExxY protein, partial [Verrucomicrobiales bacterium]